MGVIKNDVGRPSNKTIATRNILKALGALVIVGLAFGLGYYLKDKGKKENKEETKAASIKVNDDKDYVYDADYKYDNKYQQNTSSIVINKTISDGFDGLVSNNPQNISELKAPYININTDDAKTVNAKIKELYEAQAKKFDLAASGQTDEKGTTLGYIYMYYKTFKSADYLSVIVVDGTASSQAWLNYYTYVFNLKTGKLLTYDDVLKVVKLTKDEVNDKIDAKFKKDLEDGVYDNVFSSETECKEDIKNVKNNLANGKLYFMDSDDNLNIIYYSATDYESSLGHVLTLK